MFRRPQAEKDKFRELDRKREYRTEIKNQLLTSLGNSFLAGASSSSGDGNLPKLAIMTASGKLVCKLCKHESQDLLGFQVHVKLELHKRALVDLKEDIEVQKTVIEHIQNLIKAETGESDLEPIQEEMHNINHQNPFQKLSTRMDIEETSIQPPNNPEEFLSKRKPLTTMKIEERVVETSLTQSPPPEKNNHTINSSWEQATSESLISILTKAPPEPGLESSASGTENLNPAEQTTATSSILKQKQHSDSEKTKERLQQLKDRALRNRTQPSK
jgi:hypothetical protein